MRGYLGVRGKSIPADEMEQSTGGREGWNLVQEGGSQIGWCSTGWGGGG